MCFGSEKPDPPPPPPVPPPPPPVLEQAAPATAAPTAADDANNAALGTKKYKSRGLSIDTGSTSGATTSSGLGTNL